MKCGPIKEKKSIIWFSPLFGVLKFNVDGAYRGKLGRQGLENLFKIVGENITYVLQTCWCV